MDENPTRLRLMAARSKAATYCKAHGITLLLDWPQCQKNEGAYAADTIWMGKFSDELMFCAVFCHELGHHMDEKSGMWRKEWSRGNRVANELTAWGRVPRDMFEIFGVKIDDRIAWYIGDRIASYQWPRKETGVSKRRKTSKKETR